MTPICAATLALSLACATPAAHALDNLRPGLWEFRSTRLSVAGLPDMSAQMGMLQQHIKGLPADTRRMLEQQMQQRGVSLGADGSVRSCITAEQARQDNIFAGKVEGNCTLTRVERSGNTIRGSLRCTDPAAEWRLPCACRRPGALRHPRQARLGARRPRPRDRRTLAWGELRPGRAAAEAGALRPIEGGPSSPFSSRA